MEPDPVAVGNRIRAARQAAGLSVKELARRAHISPSHLSDIERGVKHPSLAVAATLAQILGRSLDWVVAGRDPLPDPVDLRTLLRDPARPLWYQGVPLTEAAREQLVDLLDAAWNLARLAGASVLQALGAPHAAGPAATGKPGLPPDTRVALTYPDEPAAREWIQQTVADVLSRYWGIAPAPAASPPAPHGPSAPRSPAGSRPRAAPPNPAGPDGGNPVQARSSPPPASGKGRGGATGATHAGSS
ncbi:transcriptional regulator, XRE family [Thermaerobacter marianensis DSM 12885]|uniref:Transcriptional regulator, XRE family n=1 Tax=Thermaerobacter marianensis (strain ATCC 700841 / DSM 12885 / JCM 10246 / 7p75a) TaxID=644966 RepID=E6SL51_THEM7|nr:helix-turn-helix transcriptional regulator [Thermaerobacter marianensis]ADU50253.1 transcriptional regulator, XRE family [Thermaerobacter marianensis DSM 12885]